MLRKSPALIYFDSLLKETWKQLFPRCFEKNDPFRANFLFFAFGLEMICLVIPASIII